MFNIWYFFFIGDVGDEIGRIREGENNCFFFLSKYWKFCMLLNLFFVVFRGMCMI